MRGAVGTYPHPLEGMAEGERMDPHRFAERKLRQELYQLNLDIEDSQEKIEESEQRLMAQREGLEASLIARESLERAIELLTP